MVLPGAGYRTLVPYWGSGVMVAAVVEMTSRSRLLLKSVMYRSPAGSTETLST